MCICARVCTRLRACLRVCVRACARVYVCACVHVTGRSCGAIFLAVGARQELVRARAENVQKNSDQTSGVFCTEAGLTWGGYD